MLFRPVMALTFFAFCLAGYPVNAQDQPTDGAMAAFNNVNQQWEDVNKQIEALMTEARTADRGDAAAMNALREKFIGLQNKGKDLLPQLRSTGMAAYQEVAEPSEALSTTLVSIAASEAMNDQFQDAKQIVDLLLQKQSDQSQLFDIAGMIAFGMDDFKTAQAMFEKAAEAGSLQVGARYQPI